jgi:hypothetical protein
LCAWRCGFVRALEPEVEKTYTGRAAAGEVKGGDGGGRWAFKERREDDGQGGRNHEGEVEDAACVLDYWGAVRAVSR